MPLTVKPRERSLLRSSNPSEAEIVAGNLKKPGWSLGYVSTLDASGRTIWIADAHRDGKRFVVRADEKLTAFMELESATLLRLCAMISDSSWLLEFLANPSSFGSARVSPSGHLKVQSSDTLGAAGFINLRV